MSASVYPASPPAKRNGYRYQAWCEEHADGLNAGARGTAEEWAERHNKKEHSSGEEEAK